MKFELKKFIGKKVVYHSIFSFEEEQRKTYLDEVIKDQVESSGTHWYALEGELEEAAARTFGRKKSYAMLPDDWNDDSVTEFINKYPDIALAAALASRCYSVSHDPDIEFRLPEGATEDCMHSDLENYSWKCDRIE